MNSIDPASSLSSSLVAGAMRQLENMSSLKEFWYIVGDKLSSSLSDGTLVTVGRR